MQCVGAVDMINTWNRIGAVLRLPVKATPSAAGGCK
jgi:hypothetical protein